MVHYKKLAGRLCYLSPCSVDDADTWAQWDNDLEVTIPLGDEAYTPMPLDKVRESLADSIKRQSHLFAVVDEQTDTMIGRCMLFDLDQVNQTAMLGICIGEKAYWGKGYGQDAVALLLDYGFNLLNLRNIMLGVFAFNERAIRCYLKLGFKEIGRRRQARVIAGRAYDVVLMDILASEFVSPLIQGVVARATASAGRKEL